MGRSSGASAPPSAEAQSIGNAPKRAERERRSQSLEAIESGGPPWL